MSSPYLKYSTDKDNEHRQKEYASEGDEYIRKRGHYLISFYINHYLSLSCSLFGNSSV